MPACTVSVEIPSGGVAEVPDLTGELTALDNRTPAHLLVIEQDPPAGTLVGVGAYIITTTITDQSGNQTVCTNVFCVTAEAGGPFFNTAQSVTISCPEGTTGTSKTATIAAGTYSSNVSQDDANAQALAAAIAQANAALCCCPIGEECEECPDDVYPYGFGYENFYELYDYPLCYPYGYGCYPPPTIPSYVINHWWKMNECGTNTVRRDSIGTADLTPSVVSGTNGCSAGVVGNANVQTGSSVNLQSTSTELMYFNNGMTLFGWFRMNRGAAGAVSLIIDYELVFGSAADRIRILGNFPASLSDSATFRITEDVTDDPIVDGTWPNNGFDTWMFFIATHNGANGSLTLEVKTVAHHLIITSPTNWTPAFHNTGRIFFYASADTRLFDECGIIYRILTQAEKDFLWNGGAGRSWPFA